MACSALLRGLALACVGLGAAGLGGCAGASSPGIELPDFAGIDPGGDDLSSPFVDDLGTHDLAKSDMKVGDMKAGDMASSGSTCNPSATTLGAAGGPDTCAYGERCDDVMNKCVAVTVGSCNMVGGAPTWNMAAKLAPVITKATATLLATTNASTECANGDPAALVTIEWYAPGFLTTQDVVATFLAQVKFKKSTVAGDPFFSATFERMAPVKNTKVGSFQVGINCGGAGGSVKTAGMYIEDEAGHVSNPICVTW